VVIILFDPDQKRLLADTTRPQPQQQLIEEKCPGMQPTILPDSVVYQVGETSPE
jgi:hypothetical protein